ncbi:hypothetical protein [Hymenobacter psoromatis]|uniref:hypothetical protein n=1 Tax=Hymenobacter psoromatis TaxID=1484116 RepID=UPI001CC12955|nr:hypothetical protein [Hymenobacter psoromatis]
MAQQTGILGIKGTVGGLVFAKDGSVRQKQASNKSKFMGAASMARTRENASEFGTAAQAGKVVRDALRSQIQAASDSKMISRLTQAMRAIISLDTTSARGQRVVQASNAAQLLGFNFNLGAGLGQSLFSPYSVVASGADVTLSIPRLDSQIDVRAPQGATHYELLYGVASVNFTDKTYKAATVASALGILALTSPAKTSVSITATLPAAPTADELVLAVVGMNYYQQLNGQYYPLNNNASNPLAVEYTSAKPLAGGGGAGTTYGTHLAGPNGSGAGVTLAASAGDGFDFDELTTGGSAPASMDINIGGTQVASVAYLDRYTGKPFSFTHAGVAHTGAFAATVNF